MTTEQYRIVAQALGVKADAKELPSKFLRNHLIVRHNTYPYYKGLLELQDKGIMDCGKTVGNQSVFHVTPKGKELFKKNV